MSETAQHDSKIFACNIKWPISEGRYIKDIRYSEQYGCHHDLRFTALLVDRNVESPMPKTGVGEYHLASQICKQFCNNNNNYYYYGLRI